MDILGYPDRDILVVPRISGHGRRGRFQGVPDILGYPDRDILVVPRVSGQDVVVVPRMPWQS